MSLLRMSLLRMRESISLASEVTEATLLDFGQTGGFFGGEPGVDLVEATGRGGVGGDVVGELKKVGKERERKSDVSERLATQ